MGPREAKGRTTLRVNAADGSRVTIHVFPQDARFVRDIERVLDELRTPALPEARLRARLQASLRAWYPMLEVRERIDLAEVDLDEAMWYAMRDGYVSRPRDRIDRLHAVMSDARVTSATSSAVIEQARETLDRASRPRAGRPVAVVERDGPEDIGGSDPDDEEIA